MRVGFWEFNPWNKRSIAYLNLSHQLLSATTSMCVWQLTIITQPRRDGKGKIFQDFNTTPFLSNETASVKAPCTLKMRQGLCNPPPHPRPNYPDRTENIQFQFGSWTRLWNCFHASLQWHHMWKPQDAFLLTERGMPCGQKQTQGTQQDIKPQRCRQTSSFANAWRTESGRTDSSNSSFKVVFFVAINHFLQLLLCSIQSSRGVCVCVWVGGGGVGGSDLKVLANSADCSTFSTKVYLEDRVSL